MFENEVFAFNAVESYIITVKNLRKKDVIKPSLRVVWKFNDDCLINKENIKYKEFLNYKYIDHMWQQWTLVTKYSYDATNCQLFLQL